MWFLSILNFDLLHCNIFLNRISFSDCMTQATKGQLYMPLILLPIIPHTNTVASVLKLYTLETYLRNTFLSSYVLSKKASVLTGPLSYMDNGQNFSKFGQESLSQGDNISICRMIGGMILYTEPLDMSASLPPRLTVRIYHSLTPSSLNSVLCLKLSK